MVNIKQQYNVQRQKDNAVVFKLMKQLYGEITEDTGFNEIAVIECRRTGETGLKLIKGDDRYTYELYVCDGLERVTSKNPLFAGEYNEICEYLTCEFNVYEVSQQIFAMYPSEHIC